jgi:hypothetical protein
MTFHQRIGIGLLLVGLAGGCDGQDPTQPAVGSISVGARKGNLAPNRPSAETKKAPALRR